MEYLVIWLLCAVVCGMVANSKGRSVGGWVVWGIVLGFIGIIIIVCLPSLPKSEKDIVVL